MQSWAGRGHPLPRYRLGIDIGGTFTDMGWLDQATGELGGLKPHRAQRPFAAARPAALIPAGA
jgi:hypothetical protein